MQPDATFDNHAQSASDGAAILRSVCASIELALHQLASDRQASGIEILREAIREARGEPLILQ
jgi:hypothetical protein